MSQIKFLPALIFLLLSFSLAGCASACPPVCLGEKLGAVDWRGKNMRGSNMVNSLARQSNLSEVDFSDSDLSGFDLYGSITKSINLTDAALIGTNLEGATLSGANFTNANLTGASLVSADLSGTQLTSAELTGVIFLRSRLVNSNLSLMNLAGAYMDYAIMSGSNFSHTRLSGGLLDKVDLSGADLHSSDLSGAWINFSTLVGANLKDANLSGASLIGTDLTGCDLSGSSLTGARLVGANLRGADLRGTDLSGAELVAIPELVDRLKMDDPTLRNMSEAQWSELNLGNTALDGAKYDDHTRWPAGFQPPNQAVYQPVNQQVGTTSAGYQNSEVTINLAGSNSVARIVTPLARAFMEKQPGVNLKIDATESSIGISRVGTMSADIGMSSRQLSQLEMAQYPNLQAIPIARDGIAVVLSLDNNITGLSMPQLHSIFSGEIRNWKELGGADREISLVLQTNTLSEVFLGLVMGGESVNETYLKKLPSDAAVRAQVSREKSAIGVLPFSMVDKSLRAVPVNGITPDAAEVSSGQYPLIRPYYLILRPSMSSVVHSWMDFVSGVESQQIILREGLEPIPNE